MFSYMPEDMFLYTHLYVGICLAKAYNATNFFGEILLYIVLRNSRNKVITAIH